MFLVNSKLHILVVFLFNLSFFECSLQEVLFEKVFVDAIKCVISSVDLEVMGVTEADLLATCANKNVILLRNTLGFLY